MCLYRQLYALKEIDLQGMSRREQEECIKETQILSGLESPYIVKYYDSFLEAVRSVCICPAHSWFGGRADVCMHG
jgi:serine/threonine protein kinase